MAGDGTRVISTANKNDSCKGKKRALTGEAQQGIVSSMVRTSKGKEVKTSGTKNSDHELHIQTERDHRKRMQDLPFLQAFHSHLPPKIDKATIVEETVNYVKNLECTLETLQKQKLDHIQSALLVNQKPSSAAYQLSSEYPISREAFLVDQVGKVPSPLDTAVPLPPPAQHCYSIQTWTSPNVVLSIVGVNAYIRVCTPKKPGLITAAVFFLERHGAEALAVQSYSDRPLRTMFARVNEDAGCFNGTAMPTDERFKLALGELIIWLGATN